MFTLSQLLCFPWNIRAWIRSRRANDFSDDTVVGERNVSECLLDEAWTCAYKMLRVNACRYTRKYFFPDELLALCLRFLTCSWIVCSHLWYANRRRCSWRCLAASPLNFKHAYPMSRSLRCVIFLAEVQCPASVHLEKKQRLTRLPTSTCCRFMQSACSNIPTIMRRVTI